MAYRKYLSRNPEENLHLLEQQILLGEIEAVEPYVLMLNRTGTLKSKNLPLDLEICKSFFEPILEGVLQLPTPPDSSLILEYLNLELKNQETVRKILGVSHNLAKVYVRNLTRENSEVRPNIGFGKFRFILDSYIYQLEEDDFFSNDHWGDNARIYNLEPSDLGMINDYSLEDSEENLTAEEMNLIVNSAGAILHESGNGFVRVTFYTRLRALSRAWDQMEDQFALEEGGEEGDEVNDISSPDVEE